MQVHSIPPFATTLDLDVFSGHFFFGIPVLDHVVKASQDYMINMSQSSKSINPYIIVAEKQFVIKKTLKHSNFSHSILDIDLRINENQSGDAVNIMIHTAS